ncbi:MAG: hypothetical protein ACJ76F_05895 [Bacteroidia bacterium]
MNARFLFLLWVLLLFFKGLSSQHYIGGEAGPVFTEIQKNPDWEFNLNYTLRPKYLLVKTLVGVSNSKEFGPISRSGIILGIGTNSTRIYSMQIGIGYEYTGALISTFSTTSKNRNYINELRGFLYSGVFYNPFNSRLRYGVNGYFDQFWIDLPHNDTFSFRLSGLFSIQYNLVKKPEYFLRKGETVQ